MKRILFIISFCFLLFGYGCKKESDDDIWTISEIVVTFRLEYNSINQLIKYSKFRNNALSSFDTFSYSDTSLIQKHFDKNSEDTSQIIYVLDSNNRAVKSYSTYISNSVDTIEYSSSGFPSKIIIGNSNTFYFVDNGTDVVSENIDVLISNYAHSEALCKVSLPDDYILLMNVIPSFTGSFGSINQHLISSSSDLIAGPGGSSISCSFEYTLDSEGYVTEVKKYQKSTPRYGSSPEYGTISYVKYEYIFE